VAIRKAVTKARRERKALSKSCAPTESLEDRENSIWRRTPRKISVLDEFIKRHDGRISPSPILCLPIELLREIFANVLANLLRIENPHDIANRKIIRLASHLPWSISRVCQSWRTVALSTPYLWRSMPIVNLSSPICRRPCFLRLLQELLQRSNGSSIDVKLETGSNSVRLPHSGFELLIQHSDRWATLCIITNPKHGAGFIRDMFSIKRSFSVLRTVHILSRYTELNFLLSDNSNFTLLELRAPNLEEVMLDHPAIILATPSSNMIRKLTSIDGNSGHEVKRCLHNSFATLTDLRLTTKLRGQTILGSLALPNLTRLDFDSGEYSSHWLLDHLTAPSLYYLTLHSTFLHEDLCSVATSMIQRSHALNIFELCVSQCRNPTGFFSLLSATPNLVYLKITLPHHEDIRKLLSHSHGKFTLTPALHLCIFQPIDIIPAEMISALKTLASTRFEYSRTTTYKIYSKGRVIGRYPRRLTLDFTHLSESLLSSTQCTLHGWPESDKSQSFQVANERLKSILHGLQYAYSKERLPKLRLSNKKAKELDLILRRIWDTKIDNIGDIMVCNVQTYAFRNLKINKLLEFE